MANKVERQPAVKRPAHPAADLPDRDSVVKPETPTEPLVSSAAPTTAPAPVARVTPPGELPPAPSDKEEKFSAPVGTRVRPSTDARVGRALDNLPRSWSKQALYDAAVNEFINKYGLDPQ